MSAILYTLQYTMQCNSPDYNLELSFLYCVDIPLNPGINVCEGSFVVHWLNNKELQFTMESEKLMNDINSKTAHDDPAVDETYNTSILESYQPGRN